jgi:hypothetical protein
VSHIENDLNSLHSSDIPLDIFAENPNFLITEAFLQHGGVEGNESIVFRTNQHNLLKIGDIVALGKLHQ